VLEPALTGLDSLDETGELLDRLIEPFLVAQVQHGAIPVRWWQR